MNLAQQYVDLGYDPEVLMRRLGEIVCHDSFTEMHAFKHHQAIVEEFPTPRANPGAGCTWFPVLKPRRFLSARNMEIYEEALDLLHA